MEKGHKKRREYKKTPRVKGAGLPSLINSFRKQGGETWGMRDAETNERRKAGSLSKD